MDIQRHVDEDKHLMEELEQSFDPVITMHIQRPVEEDSDLRDEEINVDEYIRGFRDRLGDSNSRSCQTKPLTPAKLPLIVATRLALKMGRAALKYGSFGRSVETFMQSVMELHGYSATCGVMNGEMFISAYPNNAHTDDDDDEEANDMTTDLLSDQHGLPITLIIPYEDGMDLSKLGMLSDLCHDVLCQNASLKNAANKKLDEIEMTPPPFGNTAQLICFILTGGMVTIVFRGSWNDVAIASVGNIWVFFCMTLWPKLVHAQGKVFMYTACSFVPAILATLLSFFVGNVHVTISVVSSVIIPVPGYSISKGIDELINDRITLGASHCIQGLATLTWLALGGYAGKTLVISILTNLNFLEDDYHDFAWRWACRLPIVTFCPLAFAWAWPLSRCMLPVLWRTPMSGPC